MEIFPVLDLKDGVCVRLERGDFSKAKIYEHDPLKQIHVFEKAGAQWVHLVDLDGARDPALKQADIVKTISRLSPLKVQVGGGIRSRDDVVALLEAGATRVVIGSMAIDNRDEVISWIKEFGGDKVICAFDIRVNSENIPMIVTKGWQQETNMNLWDALDSYRGTGLQTIFCTDTNRDGMMQGCNIALYKNIIGKIADDFSLLASGGIATIADIEGLDGIGIHGAVIGRALYEHKLMLRDVMEKASHGQIKIPPQEEPKIPDYNDDGEMIL